MVVLVGCRSSGHAGRRSRRAVDGRDDSIFLVKCEKFRLTTCCSALPFVGFVIGHAGTWTGSSRGTFGHFWRLAEEHYSSSYCEGISGTKIQRWEREAEQQYVSYRKVCREEGTNLDSRFGLPSN